MVAMKKLMLTCGMVLFSGALMAQTADQSQAAQSTPQAPATQMSGPRHAPNPDREAKHLGKRLGLSSDQVTQLKPILADRDTQMQNLRADSSLSQTDRRAKFQSIREDSKNKIEAVLNDQQKQQFEQMLAQRRGRRGGAAATQPQTEQ